MKKVLISDFDGTIFRDFKISEKDRNSIKSLKENGHDFIIATGRDITTLKLEQKHIDFKVDYHILCNGALITDTEFNILYKKSISNNTLQQIVKSLDFENFNFGLVSDNIYMIDSLYECFQLADVAKVISKDEFLNSNEEFIFMNIVPKSKNPNDATKILNFINKNFKEVSAFQNHHIVDVIAKDTSKASAINFLITQGFYTKENIYTVGDSFNDLPMLKAFDNSFTFHHVDNKVKSIAKFHVENVSEIINKYIDK